MSFDTNITASGRVFKKHQPEDLKMIQEFTQNPVEYMKELRERVDQLIRDSHQIQEQWKSTCKGIAKGGT